MQILGWRLHDCFYEEGSEAAPHSRLWVSGLQVPDPDADDADGPAVPLHQLLAALLPPDRTYTRPGSLWLEGCCLMARHWDGCPLLAPLTDLCLLDHLSPSSIHSADVDPADVDALLRQATGLRRLDICLPTPQLPAAVAQLRGLTKLELRGAQLERLPADPCLSGAPESTPCRCCHRYASLVCPAAVPLPASPASHALHNPHCWRAGKRQPRVYIRRVSFHVRACCRRAGAGAA